MGQSLERKRAALVEGMEAPISFPWEPKQGNPALHPAPASCFPQYLPLCSQVHSSACKLVLVQGPCGILREEPFGFLKIHSINGRPLCHHLYIRGVPVTRLWASLVGPQCPSPAWHLCAVGVSWGPMMSGSCPHGAWNWEGAGLGRTGLGEHTKPICFAHVQLEPQTCITHHV